MSKPIQIIEQRKNLSALVSKYIVLLVICMFVAGEQISAKVTIAVRSTSASERANFLALESKFNQEYPDIEINIVAYRTVQYKQLIHNWLSSNTGPDVLFWHAGERLRQFVRSGYIAKLDDIWNENDLLQKFTPAMSGLVSFQGSHYAIPISYYHWGFYFNRDLFRKLELQPPQTWKQFLVLCDKLKKQNITPIAIGSSELWPVAAWFDYLNLRLKIYEFHQDLLSGKISFLDKRVINVFEHWQELVVKDYFLKGHEDLLWSEALPFVYRQLAGVTLVGNFAATILPDEIQDHIGFFAFPTMSLDIEQAEEAPTDVFFARANSNNLEHAKIFMQFAARADVQTLYNQISTGFPANNNASFEPTYFNRSGRAVLQEAKSFSQFFDRQTPEEFSAPAMAYLADFMLQPNVQKTVENLETLRLAILIEPSLETK
jgi:multiple sugar transport system substrate-binding protein